MWLARSVTDALLGAQAMLPEADFAADLLAVAALSGEVSRQAGSRLHGDEAPHLVPACRSAPAQIA
jgi:hypothetical protein